MDTGKLFDQSVIKGDTWREQFLILDQDEFGVDLTEYDKIQMIIRKDLNPDSPLLYELDNTTPSSDYEVIIEGDENSQMTIIISKDITKDFGTGVYWRDIVFWRDETKETLLRGKVKIVNNL
jgi:hypothetical protein